MLFTTRTALRRVPEVANTVPSLSDPRLVIDGMATESNLVRVPVSPFTAKTVNPVSSATNRCLPPATSSVGEFGVTNGDPGTAESPPSRLILKPRMTLATWSAVNKNCVGTCVGNTADIPVGVGVAVGVGVGLISGVGEPVGLGDGGLLITIRRGEIVPHAAIMASRHNIQTTIQLRFGLERGSIFKEDACSWRTVAARAGY